MIVVFLQIEIFFECLHFSLTTRHSFHSIYVNVGATSSTDYRGSTDVFADERRYT